MKHTSTHLAVAVAALAFVGGRVHAQESRVAASEEAKADPEDESGAAAAVATVLHVPPVAAEVGRPLRLVAVVDAAWTEAALVARYRALGAPAGFREAPFERSSAGGYYATIPAADLRRPGIEYYIAGITPEGKEVPHFASAEAPQSVRVEPSWETRWTLKERRRLGGYVSSVSVDLTGQNFGNRYDKSDYFYRGEIDWTHRLLTRLYAISLGYGFIEGRTPASEDPGASELKKGARYGYGAVLLRLHRAAWLETRAGIGVDRDGFIIAGRAKLTLGRPWRSGVDLGAEIIENIGPTFWVRLQWDTVPPFLMGAAVVKSDLPDASLDNGSYIVYDISYPVTPRIAVRGSLSYGSRDGPGNFGGGLGTSFSF